MDENKVRLPDGRVATRTRIIGTRELVYHLWEPTDLLRGPHASVMSIDGAWHGQVGTARLPAVLDAELAPGTEERKAAVDAHYGLQREAAYRAIESAFPETKGGTQRDLGVIRLVLPVAPRPTLAPFSEVAPSPAARA